MSESLSEERSRPDQTRVTRTIDARRLDGKERVASACPGDLEEAKKSRKRDALAEAVLPVISRIRTETQRDQAYQGTTGGRAHTAEMTDRRRGDSSSRSVIDRLRRVFLRDANIEAQPRKSARFFAQADQVPRAASEGGKSSFRGFPETFGNPPVVEPNRASRIGREAGLFPASSNRTRGTFDEFAGAPDPDSATIGAVNQSHEFSKRRSTEAAVNQWTADRVRNERRTPSPALIESSDNAWPALPAAPEFEIADELAAMKTEAERLRHLEREQRGTWWNE